MVGVLVLAIGVSVGLTGYGGFLVPALLVGLLDQDPRQAVAHGLASFVLPGVLGAYLYWRSEHRPSGTVALLLCVGTVPGILAGRALSLSVADTALQVILGLLVAGAGLLLALPRRRRRVTAAAADRLPARLAPLVLGAGFLGGMAAVVGGVGGPLVTVPILVAAGLPLAPSVGAALLNAVVVVAAGTGSLVGAVGFGPVVLAVVTAAQLAGVPVGVWLQRRVRSSRLVPAIAAVSALVGVGLVYGAVS